MLSGGRGSFKLRLLKRETLLQFGETQEHIILLMSHLGLKVGVTLFDLFDYVNGGRTGWGMFSGDLGLRAHPTLPQTAAAAAWEWPVNRLFIFTLFLPLPRLAGLV